MDTAVSAAQLAARQQATFRPSYRKGTEESVLGAIREPDVNCTVWLRSLPPHLDTTLAKWASEHEARYDQIVGGIDSLAPVLDGIEDPEVRDWLREDIHALAQRFGALTASSRYRVFFGAIRGDQCRKFHSDFLRLRLITTYSGPGTEWLPEHNVRREVLEEPPECPSEANRRIVRDRSLIERASTGDVLLLKGYRYPTAQPVVHRSPPIEGTGAVRVVLILSTFEPAP